MNTKTKSSALRYIEELRGGPLTFGRMIQSVRKADGIAQAELALKMAISRAHLCDIENGRRSVSVDRAAKFAKVLGYSVTQFVAQAVEDQLLKNGIKVKVYLEAA